MTVNTAEQASPIADCLAGGGETGALIRSIDWSRTPVGPVSDWSQPFRTLVGLVLRNRFPLSLWWGPKLVQFYNDPFVSILGFKHPAAMGQSGSDCWAEIWATIGPMIEGPFAGGPATGSEDLSLLIHRSGFLEETHFRVAYSPVPDESVPDTGIGGVLATVSETTAQVQAERQFRTLRSLAARAGEATSEKHACENAAATLADNSADVPFALFYLLDDDGTRGVLIADSGFSASAVPAMPLTIDVRSGAPTALWPLAASLAHRRSEVVRDLDARFGVLPTGPWAEPPRSAIVLPLAGPDLERPYGVMIAGISPHRELDDGYRSFLELAAAQVALAIRNTRAFEEERRHAEGLAQIDRAKTVFFSNVSHEFRTPLALMIGPIEDARASDERALRGDALDMAHRNSLRLLKLVNSLLDFSRLEAGRVEASFQATDLGQLTADLASQFRAAMEKGGLRLQVDAQPLGEVAFVDRDMWEKIVFNLLSNAFKHTFEGVVSVGIVTTADRVRLTVRDTGIGVPEDELPRIFDRFHRVLGSRTRSHEGTGIGLSLVRELVKIHGGTVTAESRVGVGTCLEVSIPVGFAHLPAERVEAARVSSSTAVGAAAYVNEALSWLSPDDSDRRSLLIASSAEPSPGFSTAGAGRILLADDNADMREYLGRILSQSWTVEAVADGLQALEAIRRQPCDVVVADVMMPNLDGLELTRALRAEAATKDVPVILLSARTGEEATSEGLAAGANDYVAKPFSSRELVARVRVQLEITRAHARDRLHEIARMKEAHFRQVAESTGHARDEFLAVLGHELRNPLAPILTAVQLMKLRGDDSFVRERSVIERQVKHVVRLVDDLLDVSRMTRGKVGLERRAVGVEEIIAGALEIVGPLVTQRKHRLIVDVRPGITLDADPSRLVQVFSNLLSNAAKFTEPGGTITVSAWTEADAMVARVQDTGIGIAPALLARAFDAFAQGGQASDRAQGGLGLGLAIVRNLVALHGGQVEAHSAGLGRGSEFVVRLPLAESGSAPVVPLSVEPLAPLEKKEGLRVLVVDDNEDAAMLLSEVLRFDGHEVVVAHDGARALEASIDFVPEVALLDIGLPIMDGYELAGHLRRRYPSSGLRLFAVTGYGEEKDKARSKVAGFDEHLTKPVNVDLVRQMLATS